METVLTTFEAIGTHWDIRITEGIDSERWMVLQGEIRTRIKEFDQVYSRFRADSLVTQMSQQAGTFALPHDGFQLLDYYNQLYKTTDGKITPLIGQAVADAGYDATYSFEQKVLEEPPAWADVLAYDEHSITLTQTALLDFGAAGKGYLVDLVGELIERAGVQSYLINAGGDIRHRSHDANELEVGLENPLDTSEAIGTVKLSNRSLCASAGSKRQWGNYHHIIDPVSLQSPYEIIATWVVANNTMMADGLATALFFTDAAELSRQFSFTYAQLHKDMSLSYAKDFPISIF